jgi:predicted alpha-1,2-mannosidase
MLKKKFLLLIAAGLICVACAQKQSKMAKKETDYAKYVNPFVGTDLAGHTYPGALTPFGMIQLSPDTKLESWEGCSGYHFLDSIIYGFSHTHLNGTGCVDYGDIMLMPCTSNASINNTEYSSRFSHANETASPGYYSVLLDKNRVRVELTAAKRLGVQKYTYPDGGDAKYIVLDLKHRDVVITSSINYNVGSQTVSGIRNSRMWNDNQQLAYCIVFSQPVDDVQLYSDDAPVQPELTPDNSIGVAGKNLKALIRFKPDVREVVVKTAISANMGGDRNAALGNLAQYNDWGFDFDRFRQAARDEWNRELGKIAVETSDVEKKKVFYTAMYHAFTSPYLYTDADGSYLGMDYKMHQTENGHEIYTVFSLWDTYRALHPLLNIIDRKRSGDFLYTFMKHYEQGGALPIWELSSWETNCMIGYHSIPVVLDAFVKGIADYDKNKMLEAMLHSAKTAWRGLPEYVKYGYIPADMESEGVSKALEYAYDDWCIAQFAKATGNDSVYGEFNERCQYYKNLLDADGFMHARINGAFVEPFDPTEVNNAFTEANSWQYSTYVPHDADTYIALLGGDGVAEQHFDSLFNTSSEMTGRNQADITGLIGQYAHGNEPSHHAAYWYSFVGKPWKTAEIVRKITGEFYTSRPDGLCGNEDCGQMSAWYIFSSMGFYPFCPGTNQYVLGSPVFNRITVNLENGKQFVVVAKNQSEKNIYIQSVQLNGQPYSKSYIMYDDIKDGGELVLTLGSRPNPDFGKLPADRPHTEVKSTVTQTPLMSEAGKTFSGEMSLSMYAYQPKRKDKDLTYKYPAQTDEIYYTLDGSVPTRKSNRYTAPLKFTSDANVKAVAWNASTGYSKVVEARYAQYTKDRDIVSQTPSNPVYSGGGDDALIDGQRGLPIYNLGNWKGYEGKDVEVILDLRTSRNISEVGAGFLQDVGPWIVFPPTVSFEISDDNLVYRPYGTVKAPCTPHDSRPQVFDYTVRKPAKTRYVKMIAKCYGKMPDWHLGAGYDSHLFIDEIYVK